MLVVIIQFSSFSFSLSFFPAHFENPISVPQTLPAMRFSPHTSLSLSISPRVWVYCAYIHCGVALWQTTECGEFCCTEFCGWWFKYWHLAFEANGYFSIEKETITILFACSRVPRWNNFLTLPPPSGCTLYVCKWIRNYSIYYLCTHLLFEPNQYLHLMEFRIPIQMMLFAS